MDYVDEIKQKINIIEVVSPYVALKKTGKNLKGLCPFHKEKTPSFIVSDDIGRYKCFGCGKSGDIFNFLMEIEGIDFAQSAEILANKAGVKIDFRNFDKDKNIRINKLYDANRMAMLFYQNVVFKTEQGKKAYDYLQKRGLSKKDVLEHKLGFSPQSWSSLAGFLTKKSFSEDVIADAGLVKRSQKGVYDVFRNRLMVPLIDQFGKTVGFSARALDDNLPKYINTQDTEIYHKQNFLYGLNLTKAFIREEGYVIIVEGFFDLITPYIKGIKNILATSGTALTPNQIKLIRRFTDTVVFLFDNDKAGLGASLRAIDSLPLDDINVKIAILDEEYKDPDEAALKDLNSLKGSIKNAMPIWDFYFVYAKETYDLEDVYSKKKASSFIASKLKKITDPVLRDDYYKKFAVFFDTEVSVAKEAIDTAHTTKDATADAIGVGGENAQSNSGVLAQIAQDYESYILALTFILEYDIMVSYINLLQIDHLKNPLIREVFEEVINYINQTKGFNRQKFYGKILKTRPYLKDILERAFLFDFDSKDIFDDSNKLEAEITSAALRVEKGYISRRLKELVREIQKAESINDLKKLSSLLSEVKTLQTQKT